MATRNRRWVWVFAVLAVLGVAAVSINWVLNPWQQLTIAELQRQRKLWKEAGPRDYLLECEFTAGSDRRSHIIEVRNGHVVSALYKAKPDMPGEPMRADQYGYYTMPGLFDQIEQFLEQDAQPAAGRAFNQAQFDDKTGRLIRYNRSKAGVNVKIVVTRFKPGTP
jgi:hypothetical protein